MTLTPDDLVAGAAGMARAVESGEQPSQSVLSMLRATVSTMDEQRRHQLANRAAEQAGQLGQVALQFLRVAIFALA